MKHPQRKPKAKSYKLQALLAALLAGLASASPASVPLRWTVETSRVSPAVWEAYHGETLALEASLQSYGRPLAATNQEVRIYWQTNGMGTAYWSAPAWASNSVLRAEFTPAMDPGAPVVNGFVGSPGDIYRASFQLRFRPSPGAVPNVLPLPVPTLDFATVAVLNPPYYTQEETDDKIDAALADISGKQDKLTFDNAPTWGSTNPVTSVGIKIALSEKVDATTQAHYIGDILFGPDDPGMPIIEAKAPGSSSTSYFFPCNQPPGPYDVMRRIDLASATNGLLRADYASLTNNQEFIDAVEVVSPPPDISSKADIERAAGFDWYYAPDRAMLRMTSPTNWAFTSGPRRLGGPSYFLSRIDGRWVFEAGRANGATYYPATNNTPVLNSQSLTFSVIAEYPQGTFYEEQYTLVRTNEVQASRVAYRIDIPPIISNTVTKSYVESLGIESGIQEETDPVWEAEKSGYAKTEDLASASDAADAALAYAQGSYLYMLGNTNAWFEGTNYVVDASADTAKVKFSIEDGMDLLSMPCSMSLWENRDGARRAVWDQRDWTAWYWSFKAAQWTNAVATAMHTLETNTMRRGWSKYTAVNGLDNPDPSTLHVDTPNITLSPGAEWQKTVEVRGTGYWTIQGNGLTIGPEITTNGAFLTIKDFEGNAALTIRKTASQLVWATREDFSPGSYRDNQDRVVFTLSSDTCPIAEFSTTLYDADFVEETDPDVPADFEWTGSSGAWQCHFLLKSGINSQTCFARFKILQEGENVVEHHIPLKISGGISFEQGGTSYKIKPVVNGSTVTWQLVN